MTIRSERRVGQLPILFTQSQISKLEHIELPTQILRDCTDLEKNYHIIPDSSSPKDAIFIYMQPTTQTIPISGSFNLIPDIPPTRKLKGQNINSSDLILKRNPKSRLDRYFPRHVYTDQYPRRVRRRLSRSVRL